MHEQRQPQIMRQRMANLTTHGPPSCRSHSTGNCSMSPGSVILLGCRPSRIASTIFGASSVSRSRRETSDELIFSPSASSSIVP